MNMQGSTDKVGS